MTVRIGFAGAGSMGQCAHLKHYATLPGCEVVALAEMHESKGRAVARRYGVPTFYTHIEDMIASEKLDGLVAAQPFTRHTAARRRAGFHRETIGGFSAGSPRGARADPGRRRDSHAGLS